MTLQQAPRIKPVETAASGAEPFDLDFGAPSEARPRRGRWRVAAVAIVALAGAGAAYWYFGTGTESAASALTVPVTRGDVIDTVSALGNLQPREYVDIGAQVSGQLKTIHVEVGQEVKSGDLMAEIDPVVLNAKVEAGRASLASQRAQLIDKEAQRDLANQTLERQRRLVATKAVSETTFETAEATARSAGAQVEMLEGADPADRIDAARRRGQPRLHQDLRADGGHRRLA